MALAASRGVLYFFFKTSIKDILICITLYNVPLRSFS